MTPQAATPGRALRLWTLVHAAIGVAIYRRELRAIAAEGLIGAVPYRSPRAAALWFIGTAMPGWLVGRYVDLAAEAGDSEAMRRAGLLGAGAGIGGALLMPRSPMWVQALICARIVRDSRRSAPAPRG